MKTTPTKIKTACCELLADTFPDMTVYGNDTLDGYSRPALFTELRCRLYEPLNARLTTAGYSLIITLFEKTHSEAYCYEILEELYELFHTAVRVDGRHLVVESIEYQWIDTNADKLQVTVDFAEFTEIKTLDDVGDRMESLEVDLQLQSAVEADEQEISEIIAAVQRSITYGTMYFTLSSDGELYLHEPDTVDDVADISITDDGSMTVDETEQFAETVDLEIERESGSMTATLT